MSPAALISDPQITTTRAPKQSVSLPATGPKRPVAAMANDPTHAEIRYVLCTGPPSEMHEGRI